MVAVRARAFDLGGPDSVTSPGSGELRTGRGLSPFDSWRQVAEDIGLGIEQDVGLH